MKNLLFCSIISCFIFHVTTVEIKMDPRMRDGSPSYIYCDVGTVTAGINFFTEPNTGKGLCLGPGAPCSSTLYTLTQNTTGALLEIPSVDVSREEGVWYCEHDTDRSTNTISLNDHTITGILLRQNWTERAGPVDTFSAVMTLSCASQAPNVSFTFKDSESNTGTVPPEAVSTTTKSLFDGTTCENGNKFYEITLTASNSLDVFNNKQGVRFSFNYYGNNITAPFSVNFTAFSESTTESPTTGPDPVSVTTSDNGPSTDEKIGIGVGVCALVAIFIGIAFGIYKCYKKKKVHNLDKKREPVPLEPQS